MSNEYAKLASRVRSVNLYRQTLNVQDIIRINCSTPSSSVSDEKMDYYAEILELTAEYVEDLKGILDNQLNKDQKKLKAIEDLLQEN